MSKSSVFDEYIKIAAEKGWVVDEDAYPSIVDKVQKDIHKSVEEKVQNMPKGPAETAMDAAKEKAQELIQKNKQQVTQLPEVKVETQVPKSGNWVIGVQNVLARKTPYQIKIDGYWGPQTAKAWNALAGAYKGLINAVDPSGQKVPHPTDIKWVRDAYPNLFAMGLPKGEHKRSMHDKTTGRYTEVEPTYQDRESRGLMAEDKTMTLKRNAEIMKELVALASDLEELGANKVAQVVDKETRRFKKAMDGLYDVTGETGKDLIDEAHPGGGVVIAPSQEEGGKVETIIEEQEKNIKKVLKDPTGKYAKYINELIILANKFEDEGKVEEAKMIDKTISELHEAAKRPFLNKDLVSGATKSNDLLAPKKAEESFGNRFYHKLNQLINALISSKENIELWVIGTDVDDRMEAEYDKAIANLKNVLQEFDSMGPKNILLQISRTMRVLETSIVGKDLEEAFNEEEDIKQHHNVIKLGNSLINEMKQYFSSLEQQEKQPFVKQDEKQENVLEKSKKDYLHELKNLDLIVKRYPYKLSKVVGGDENLLELENWIQKQKYNIIEAPEGYEFAFSPKPADVEKIKQYTLGLVKALRKKASIKKEIKKTSDAIPSIGPVQTTTNVPKKGPSRKKLSFDPKVQKLQQVIMQVEGLPKLKPGRGGKPDDGIWGPSTASVYNALMKMAQKVSPGALVYSVTQQKPAQHIIDWGIKVGEILQDMNKQKTLSNIGIPVYDNLIIPISILQNVNSFVNFIDINREKLPSYILSKVEEKVKMTKLPEDIKNPWKDNEEKEKQQLAGFVIIDIYQKLYNQSFVQKLILSTRDSKIAEKIKGFLSSLLSKLSPEIQKAVLPGKTQTKDEKSNMTPEEQKKFELKKLINKPGGILIFNKIDISSAEDFYKAFSVLPKPLSKPLIIGISRAVQKSPKTFIYELGLVVGKLMDWVTSNSEIWSENFNQSSREVTQDLANYYYSLENVARQLEYYDIAKEPQREIYKKVW